MDILCFSTKPYDRRFLEAANASHAHALRFTEARLTPQTAALAQGVPCVCAFVNDPLDAEVLRILSSGGTRLIALRSAGFNNVDLQTAAELGMKVVRVPEYSPHAVAEHTLALILGLNRRLYRAYNRVREGNFALEGLLGFDLHGKTAGVVGTGRIGAAVIRALSGFGCRILASDPRPNPDCLALGAQYAERDTLFAESDIVTLHCPLSPDTYHLIDERTLALMRPGVMLINTGRGALIDTQAVIGALKTGKIGFLGLDVYEEESDLFFEDLSGRVIQDDVFSRLLTFHNVLITGHQAFFTVEALERIAATTLANVTAFEKHGETPNAVEPERFVRKA